MAPSTTLILGLDPGSRAAGYGLVADASGVLRLVDAGVIRCEGDMDLRLGKIYAEVARLIAAHGPTEAAVEDVFVSGNAKSSLKLGQARGAAMAACAVAGVRVFEYEPSRVKKSLVGVGRAEKSQVAFMVGRLLGESRKFPVDASDALAVAICHLNQRRFRRLTEA